MKRLFSNVILRLGRRIQTPNQPWIPAFAGISHEYFTILTTKDENVILEGVPISSGRLKNLRVGWATDVTFHPLRPFHFAPLSVQGDNKKRLFSK